MPISSWGNSHNFMTPISAVHLVLSASTNMLAHLRHIHVKIMPTSIILGFTQKEEE